MPSYGHLKLKVGQEGHSILIPSPHYSVRSYLGSDHEIMPILPIILPADRQKQSGFIIHDARSNRP